MTDKQLRLDIICEKMRSPWEIRHELACQYKIWRKCRETCEYTLVEIAQIKIRILKWILREDKTPQAYYKEQYGREYPY